MTGALVAVPIGIGLLSPAIRGSVRRRKSESAPERHRHWMRLTKVYAGYCKVRQTWQGLHGLGRVQADLEAIVGSQVDLVPAGPDGDGTSGGAPGEDPRSEEPPENSPP